MLGRLLRIPATAIVIGFGLFTLVGLLVGENLGFLSDFVRIGRVRESTDYLLQLVVVSIGVTVLIGIVNLFWVHLARIGRRAGGWGYSVVLILSTLAVLILTVLERTGALQQDPPITRILLEQVQVSIESALAGLLLFALVYGAFRVLRQRVTFWGLLFTISILVVLVGALPLGVTLLADLNRLWLDLPVSAGARGILLGIALATVVTGLRILLGQDRSYRE
ncbi:MAG: hypothetical protein K8L99_08980 [Anaerolineae bacterium]|nr:hypothetical protein [Anaerolineae bacterium]